MPELILIRHSITEPDASLNSHEWQLSADGQQKSKLLAEYLRPYPIAKIYTSEEAKAIETGAIVGKSLGIACETAQDLDETRRKGLDFTTSPAEFKAQVREAMQYPDELRFGEETFNAAKERFLIALEKLLAKHPNESIALVSHGRVLAMVLGHLTGENPIEIWDSLKMPAYVVLSYPEKKVLKFVRNIAEEV